MGDEGLSLPVLHLERAWPLLLHTPPWLCSGSSSNSLCYSCGEDTSKITAVEKTCQVWVLRCMTANTQSARENDPHYTRTCCFNKIRCHLLSTYSAPGTNVILTYL